MISRERRRASIVALLALVAASVPRAATAQRTGVVPRVGVLYIGRPSPSESALGGLGVGMRDLGYVDGRNVVYEWRYAEGNPDRLEALAAALVASNVDVIVAGGPGPLAAARRATSRIPIVTVSSSDPVGDGWAASLAHPGGNVTGLAVTFVELGAKRLELAKQALPGLARVAVLFAPAELRNGGADDIASMTSGARSLGLQLQLVEVREAADLERAVRRARDGGAQALLTLDTSFVLNERARIGALAAREKLPVIGEFTIFGTDGVILAYGADIDDLLRRAASHVDRILKGARPGDLPIELPTKFDLVVNLKMARELGITVPRPLLLRAARIVE